MEVKRLHRAKVEYYSDAAGEFRWRLKGSNGRIMAVCGEGYSSMEKAIGGFRAVRRVTRHHHRFFVVDLSKEK